MGKKMLILTVLCFMFTSNIYAKDIDIEIPRNTDIVEIPRTTISEEEKLVLHKIAVAEAGNTTPEMICHVMYTVLNRVESDEFPNTIEEVVKQKGQFSTYPDKYNKAEPNEKSLEAMKMIEENLAINNGQLFFENTKKGSWISTHKQFIFSLDSVCFYK